jgi:S-formylglutathione hydrolase FrmB
MLTIIKKTSRTLVFLILFQIVWAYDVQTQLILSDSMGKNIPATIILPETYKSGNDNYSVAYVLHGYGGDHTNWTMRTDIEDLADQYNVIIVCPDGAKDSWYFDSVNDANYQYETHIIKELIPFIDQNYKTNAHKNSRFITGLSMGGHGALFLAIRHPELFSAVASMSGGVDIRTSSHKWELETRLGPKEENELCWEEHSILGLVHKFPKEGLRILIDCGVDDIFIQDNRKLHKELSDVKIPHDYIERPGGHSWRYWNRVIGYHLFFFLEMKL